ncbi:hypothetical protein [Arthrobacter sp. 2MCAF14]|uniref:hypothetical protein n=1 Tax=Arthrobacter sp. 2MCAF14 TaxID=3232982 RepID=UPI003F91DA67
MSDKTQPFFGKGPGSPGPDPQYSLHPPAPANQPEEEDDNRQDDQYRGDPKKESQGLDSSANDKENDRDDRDDSEDDIHDVPSVSVVNILMIAFIAVQTSATLL